MGRPVTGGSSPGEGIVYNKQDSIDALLRVAGELGRTPISDHTNANSYQANKLKGEPCTSVIVYQFGSWNSALLAAGLPLNRRQPTPEMVENGFGKKKYSDDEIFDAIRRADIEVGGSQLLRADLYEAVKENSDPVASLIRRRFMDFGGWPEIREIALGTDDSNGI